MGGTLEIDGGALVSDTELTPGLHGAALLALQNGADVWTPLVSVGPLGQVWGSGTIHADLVNAGLVEPVALLVDGDFTQLPAADLAVTLLPGMSQMGSEPLHVLGNAALDGTLTPMIDPASRPVAGSVLGILAAATVQGAFAAPLIELADGGTFQVHVEAQRVTVTAGVLLPDVERPLAP
jgi:hypothetical protein